MDIHPERELMRMLPLAGLALSGLFFSHSALAACDTVLAPDLRYIEAPGSYCLNADRARQIIISADNVEQPAPPQGL
jgi:hypothetical protein